MKRIAFIACLLTATGTLFAQKANKIVQFDISDLLNIRPVTTFTDGKLTTWTTGIDGNGLGDGYLTLSAALANGDKEPHALQDDPFYPSNNSHPEIKLYYNNTDNISNQAWSITGAGNGGLTVPRGKYDAIYLAVTSSEGASSLNIQFNYEDGDEEKAYTVPDYYEDAKPNDPTLSYLAHDLAKWGNKNNMNEKDHHNIDLLKVSPNPSRKLMSIDIRKGLKGYLVIWAVTGVKA